MNLNFKTMMTNRCISHKMLEHLVRNISQIFIWTSTQLREFSLIFLYDMYQVKLLKMDHQVSSQNNLAFSSEYINLQSSEFIYLRNQAHRSKIKHKFRLKTLIGFIWVFCYIFELLMAGSPNFVAFHEQP